MSKFPRLGKRTSNEVKGWVEPSFKDSFGVTSLVRCELRGESISNAELCGSKQSRKRKGETSGLDSCAVALPQRDCNMPWVEKHAPSSQAELAVHKRKMEEVENWIRAHCDPKTSKGGAVLLLTGPPGCGKSATVQVLARELSFGLQEWTNPSTFTEHLNHDAFRQTFDPASSFGGFPGSSQTGLFQEFLLRANKYNCLQMAGEEGPKDRKVILVEDFPNQFYRQPRSLHDILRRFVRTGRCPLVFIVSDSLRGDSSSKLLFPREVQEELAICNISFNPVAPTTMMKILTRIATLEAGKSKGRICVPEKAALEQLCSGSSGDIRSAINSMQFSLIADLSLEREMWMRKKNRSATSLKKAVSKATQGTRQPKETKEWADGQAIGGKDVSLFLFRALGKILHCKRESPDCTEGFQGQSLPAHLSEHHRNKLLVDPESVIERSHMSGEFFNLYLHQNYLDFFSEVEDVARASEYLSDADFLTGTWTPCGTMVHYGSSVATRGLLHCNNRQVSVGFRPLHKPNWLLVKKKYRENCLAAQSLFTDFCLTPVSLQTELLPYLALLTNPLRNQAQIAFIQGVGHLQTRKFSGRLQPETLTDKDPGVVEQDSEEEEEEAKPVFSAEEVDKTAPANESLQPSQGKEGDLQFSQPQPTTNESLMEEEDLLIEEYDSDE